MKPDHTILTAFLYTALIALVFIIFYLFAR
jgi:hypothetical protein